MYRCTLVNGLRRTGTLAASSWYIGKLRRAYGPQLILMDTRNETYKSLEKGASKIPRRCREGGYIVCHEMWLAGPRLGRELPAAQSELQFPLLTQTAPSILLNQRPIFGGDSFE
jgi:hypothetical protein